MSEYPIDAVKKAVKFIIDTGEVVEEKLSDGFQAGEDLPAIAIQLLGFSDIYKARKELGIQLKDIDPSERDELIAYIQSEFDLANDKIENIIEGALKVLDAILDFVDFIKDMRS